MTGPLILTAIFVGLGVAALASVWFARRKPPPNWIIVDGSNVLHWDQNRPDMQTVARVLRVIEAQGFVPVVWFDRNVGYKVGDRFLSEADLADRLTLRTSRVFLAGKDTPADPWVLAQARDLQAMIVTNDRFRDWAEAHPEVTGPGLLIRGRLEDGVVTLDLPPRA